MAEIVKVSCGKITLEGSLKTTAKATSIVLFAHGSGSSRFSPRNNYVAEVLNTAGVSTLLIDLLSAEEDDHYESRFDIKLLAERLDAIVHWLCKEPKTHKLPIGLFGSSTGAAAALQVAASDLPIRAIVSRGGRPDLAMPFLSKVKGATLLIVGGLDSGVVELNKQAYEQLHCEKEFKLIPGATHLFEEAGCLEKVAKEASSWFSRHLTRK